MRLNLRLENGDGDAARSLHEWLSGEFVVVARTDDGLTLELLAGAVHGLLTSIAGWWATRREPMRLTIFSGPVTVSIEAADPRAVADVVAALVGGADADGDGAVPPYWDTGSAGPDFPTDR